MSDVLAPVEVAKAALCEAGRPDLAERVYANRAGWPSMKRPDPDPDTEVVVRAFYLAHLSGGHDCFIGRAITTSFEWSDAICCKTCTEEEQYG